MALSYLTISATGKVCAQGRNTANSYQVAVISKKVQARDGIRHDPALLVRSRASFDVLGSTRLPAEDIGSQAKEAGWAQESMRGPGTEAGRRAAPYVADQGSFPLVGRN
jgi:hypothetical protein